MNLKSLTAPLADKITDLVDILTHVLENMEAQTELQQKINHKLDLLMEKVSKVEMVNEKDTPDNKTGTD